MKKIKKGRLLTIGATLLPLTMIGISGLSACVHRDYLYRHVVAGRVVDTEGKPVPAARVFRGETDASSETYGLVSIYERFSADDGSFRFEYSGLGPKPESHHTWHLIAAKAGYRHAALTLEIPWTMGPDSMPLGYIKEGLTMTLKAEHLETMTSGGLSPIDGTSLPFPFHLSLAAGQSLTLPGGIRLTFVSGGHLTLPDGQHVMTTEFLLEKNQEKKTVPIFEEAFGKWQELYDLRWRVVSGEGGPSPSALTIEVDKLR